jgi:hypothetical protein
VRFFGYDTWDWGSAADWFAAVGTVAAVVVALFGFRHERVRETRRNAELVIVRAQVVKATRENRKIVRIMMVSIHNAGSLEIPDVEVFVRSGKQMRTVTASDVAPGFRKEQGLSLEGRKYPRAWVSITDPLGKRFFRELPSNKYVSMKKFAKSAFGDGALMKMTLRVPMQASQNR